jgi:streptogramin lyase
LSIAFISSKYKNPSSTKYKNPSTKYKNLSFTKYKNLSFTKYKNPSYISEGLGLAVDQQDHVYICGADDIHRLSPDGTLRDIVLSKHDGVDGPWGITFNNNFTKLFIINRGKTVLVFTRTKQ